MKNFIIVSDYMYRYIRAISNSCYCNMDVVFDLEYRVFFIMATDNASQLHNVQFYFYKKRLP